MSGLTLRHNLAFEELKEVGPGELYGVDVAGLNPTTGYEYQLGFYTPDAPRIGSVRIDTQDRAAFLEQGSEAAAQGALVALGHDVKKLSGGVFSIHPFYGAIYNTKSAETVAPGFASEYEELDNHLSMEIELSDEGYKFDNASTKEALAIGTTIAVPGPMAKRFFAYMEAPKRNPNQKSRDQAITNGLGKRWDAEFARFNARQRRGLRRVTAKAIEVTPATVTSLVQNLGAQALFTEAAITTLRLRTDVAQTGALTVLHY